MYLVCRYVKLRPLFDEAADSCQALVAELFNISRMEVVGVELIVDGFRARRIYFLR